DYVERLTRALDRPLKLARLGPSAAQPLRHVVEGVQQKSHLIARGQRQAGAKIALADRAGALDEVLDGAHQALRGEDRAVDGREHREQQHEGEREAEAVLERLAPRREIPILMVGVLYRVRE